MNSAEWRKRAEQCIPGGVNSPVRSFKHVGGDPIWFEKAEGAYIYDVEGNQYVDFCLSFGPHIFGHCPPDVVEAVRNQASKAMSFGACHPKEVELAEWILKGYQFLDRVRLVNSGTEAVMTAIRLARGFTGRNQLVQFEGCYHGHSDALLAKAGSGVAALAESSSKGVPASVVADTLIANFRNLDQYEKIFEQHGKNIACVIVEPIPANNGLLISKREHLEKIIEIAKHHGALVIFDEVISGFRVGLSGASGYFDLKPDLVTLGKIIGGGLPLAALAGKQEVMECLAPLGDVYQAGTLSGNPLATAAGCTVLSKLFEKPPYAELDFLGSTMAAGLKTVLGKNGPVDVVQLGSLFWIYFGERGEEYPPNITETGHKQYAKFFRQCLSHGVYLAPSPYEVGFLSTAHTTEILNGVLDKFSKCLQ